MGAEMDLEDSTTLRCSLCNEHFREPYILKCLHTFCRECLRKQNQDKDSVICKNCEQKSSIKAMRQNCFFANIMAASLLKEFQKGDITCGNCSAGNRLLKYCKECMEYLCNACVYCHENTKLTRAHNLIPLDKFEEELVIRGQNRAVFCPAHEDNVVEQYCRSCEETICRGCEVHQEHNAVSVAEGCSIEVPQLEAVLERAISKVSEPCFLHLLCNVYHPTSSDLFIP
ncbi:E3 ubiquitin- ligase TRIM71-like [Paramuricea clavata]|uniref:E3 ubiquitin- ligase TRIM71-like n=1 Tax=Paramuricea clavata TaxID=317549 RepID=A0A7D9M7M2_PARCT|nr:E3 ubiquitin- ligase TRIM71-like [Paramuricea clavata]